MDIAEIMGQYASSNYSGFQTTIVGSNQNNKYNNPGNGRIKFKVGTTKFLNTGEKEKLNKLIAQIPLGAAIQLKGFASEEGEAVDNWDLSQRRARKIERLINEKRPNANIHVVVMGEVEGNKEYNRAVEIESYSYVTEDTVSENTVVATVGSEHSGEIPSLNGHRGEFVYYEQYLNQLQEEAMPEATWDGSDGNWLTSDRKNWTDRWQRAARAITENRFEDRLLPFQQVKDYYVWVQDQLDDFGHEVRWVRGALYLVDELQETYDEGPVKLGSWFEWSMKPLLEDLNVGIANFAISQFNRLLFGDLSGEPLRGEAAYQFDLQFVRQEQGQVAFPVYDQFAGTAGSENINSMFNGSGLWYGVGGSIVADEIPIFPEFLQSDLRDPAIRYGQQARIDVPMSMLYPGRYGPDAGSQGYRQRLGAPLWGGENGLELNDVRNAYQRTNRRIMGRSIDHYR